jgi:hypothetical protein
MHNRTIIVHAVKTQKHPAMLRGLRKPHPNHLPRRNKA